MRKQFILFLAMFCCMLPVVSAQEKTHTVTVPVEQLRVNTFTADQMKQILEHDRARVAWINSRIRQAADEQAKAEGKLTSAEFEKLKNSIVPKSKTIDEIRKEIGLSELHLSF